MDTMQVFSHPSEESKNNGEGKAEKSIGGDARRMGMTERRHLMGTIRRGCMRISVLLVQGNQLSSKATINLTPRCTLKCCKTTCTQDWQDYDRCQS